MEEEKRVGVDWFVKSQRQRQRRAACNIDVCRRVGGEEQKRVRRTSGALEQRARETEKNRLRWIVATLMLLLVLV